MLLSSYFRCFKLRSKTFQKLLLLLCLVSLIGLLVSHKNRLVHGIYPNQAHHKRYNLEMLKGYAEEELNKQPQSNQRLSPKRLYTGTAKMPNRTQSLVKIDPDSKNFTTHLKALTAKPANVPTQPPRKVTKRPVPPNTTVKAKITIPVKRLAGNVTIASRSLLNTTKVTLRTTTFAYIAYLGDKYAKDESHVNSKCPNRTTDKLRSKEFEKLFVESVPVLQWKQHARESEYVRLRKYNGAQGWKVVPWQILNETLNLLNSTGNGYMFDNWKGQSPCIRCAVVGNGGILNGSGMGKEIDAHDYVFRVNGAIIKDFEQDVGSRTSFYFFSTNTLMNSLLAYGSQGFKKLPRTEETRYVVLPDHDRDYLIVRAALTNTTVDQGRDKGQNPIKLFGPNLTTEHFKILHPDFMRYIRNRFFWDPILKMTARDIYRSSTGAAMLMAAIHTCDQVSAYGFMTPNYSSFSDHYYDKVKHKVAFYSNHSFRKEMKVWQDFHKAGVMQLYMRQEAGSGQQETRAQATPAL